MYGATSPPLRPAPTIGPDARPRSVPGPRAGRRISRMGFPLHYLPYLVPGTGPFMASATLVLRPLVLSITTCCPCEHIQCRVLPPSGCRASGTGVLPALAGGFRNLRSAPGSNPGGRLPLLVGRSGPPGVRRFRQPLPSCPFGRGTRLDRVFRGRAVSASWVLLVNWAGHVFLRNGVAPWEWGWGRVGRRRRENSHVIGGWGCPFSPAIHSLHTSSTRMMR